MEHSGSVEVPEGLKDAVNPTYPVGSKTIITEGHMEGMKGAEQPYYALITPSPLRFRKQRQLVESE